MEVALPITAHTFIAEAVVAEDGSLHLKNPSPTLKPGEKVLITVSPIAEAREENAKPLSGTVIRYNDPFGPVRSLEDGEVLRG